MTYGPATRFKTRHTAVVRTAAASLDRLEVWLPVPLDWREQAVHDVSLSDSLKSVTAVGRQTEVARGVSGPRRLTRGGVFEFVVDCSIDVRPVRTSLDD